MTIGNGQRAEMVTQAREFMGQVVGELIASRAVLEAISREQQVEVGNLALADQQLNPDVGVDFPFPGARRQILQRTATGGTVSVGAATAALVVAANGRRLGGSIVNKGAAGVTLFLAAQNTGGVGQIWLAPAGGSWDFRLGNFMWCGTILALSDAGTNVLTFTEV